jgi:RNA-dependent RNA polymerase
VAEADVGGHGSSQGSSKAVSLLAKLSHHNPKARDEFLEFIGQFRDQNKPLKQLARQGQSMSSSTHICELRPHEFGKSNEFEQIKDIVNADFTFTDGSGYASEEIMQRVADAFDFNRVSAIQMRFGGFKGVLIAHPGLGKVRANGEKTPQLLLRESMKKFEGKLLELGVIRCSTYSPAYLNRQVILLLDYLGVPEDIFLDKNEAALRNLDVKATIKRLQRQAVKIRSSSKKH